MQQLDTRLDPTWDQNKRRPDHDLLESLIGTAALSTSARSGIVRRAVGYVQAVRSGARPGLMEAFLAEYGLSSDEGVALMCLAEALLRIPDARTIDAALDLPSRGDTCFPEAVELGDDLLLYNYSSDPEGPDVSWVEGQKAPTYIVRQIVRGF